MKGEMEDEKQEGDGLFKLAGTDESTAADESTLTVETESGDEGDATISFGSGSAEELDLVDDEEPAEGEEPEEGGRAQKRIEALVSAKNTLQAQLADSQKALRDLSDATAAAEPATPEWFDTLYAGFDDPENTARFDAAMCSILDEQQFRDDPSVKKVLDRVVAEMKKRGFTLTKQEASAKKVEKVADAPAQEDWTARSLIDTSVKDVLKRAKVRPELYSVIANAVAPELLKESAASKAMPVEKRIVDAISAQVKTLGWTPEFYRVPATAEKPELRPNTGGVRSAVTSPKKATAKAETAADKPKAPTTAEEADQARRTKLRSLIGQIPAGELEASA